MPVKILLTQASARVLPDPVQERVEQLEGEFPHPNDELLRRMIHSIAQEVFEELLDLHGPGTVADVIEALNFEVNEPLRPHSESPDPSERKRRNRSMKKVWNVEVQAMAED
ncbi:MAG: hypothetical protein Greene041619_333 [Candidatus Peregrinibacteria bacterium Greene0416_19]|nr:MAG: hypothetical protein Greene041619_333 [Candidatus Peregrinibacteria bacterium Greene0416_19]